MKRVIGHVMVAVVLAAAGGIFWVLGGAERRVAAAHQALATMQYATVADTAGDLEESLQLIRPVPRIGGGMSSTVREDQSTAEYWLARYDSLLTPRDAAGASVERDPQILFVSANAAYRSLNLVATDRQDLVRSLDAIIKSYGDVLKNDGAPEDAAYNYEFLVRQRDAIARARGPMANAKAGTAVPTIHGHQGAPPKGADVSTFRIIIPKQNEEREEELRPGTGEVRQRKG